MTTESSLSRLGLKRIAAYLAAAGVLLRLAAPALLVEPIRSPLDALSWQAGLGYEICFHRTSSGADDKPDLPAPQNKRAHDCMACCAPASFVGAPAAGLVLAVREQTRIDPLVASTPTVSALSVHVVRQRGPPPV